ncbi:unnamed protein product, partial [Laminaria digitata]
RYSALNTGDDGDGGGRGDGTGSTTTTTTNTATSSGGLFTKLDPAVAARLRSARSVFALQAADVLAVFSPPPPLPLALFAPSAREDLPSRPSTAPAAIAGVGQSRHRKNLVSSDPDSDRNHHHHHHHHRRKKLSSETALRQRLHTDAADASRTGLGRPWGLPTWPSTTPGAPPRHHPKRSSSSSSSFSSFHKQPLGKTD